MSSLLTQDIKEYARSLGFDLVGVAEAQPGPHSAFLDLWLQRGYAAEMHYLARDPERRKDPRVVLPGARSVVVCALNYYPGSEPAETEDPLCGVVARFARGQDYHSVMGARLRTLADFIRSRAGKPCETRAYVDTGPVLEREMGALAGIGQFGKNTLLISPKLGSYFFLGVVISTLSLEADWAQTKDICGRCQRCLDACPTGALQSPYTLDSRRCIAYLTIEHRGVIPRTLRPRMANRIFGCDICQEVCPWNRTRPRAALDPEMAPHAQNQAPSLLEWLHMDEAEFSWRFRGSPIRRAKRRGLLRNIAVALGNAADPDSLRALAKALCDPDPLIRAHVAWALGRLSTPQAQDLLRTALQHETDPLVQEELQAATRADNQTAPG